MTRTSWIKTNFLWMMYRSGWATKPNQERILAIKLKMEGFLHILSLAVESSYSDIGSKSEWQKRIKNAEVVMQWDPDHSPKGNKLTRRAIQLGLKKKIFKKYCNEWIISINDITEFVQSQGKLLNQINLEELLVIKERLFNLKNQPIADNIGLSTFDEEDENEGKKKKEELEIGVNDEVILNEENI